MMRISRKVWFAIPTVASLALLYAVILAIANRQITRLLPRAVAAAIGGRDAGRYDVRIGDVNLSPLLSGLTVRDLAVSLDSAAPGASAEPAIVRAADFEALRVSGLKLIPLLRGEAILVSSIEVEAPTVWLDFPASVAAGAPTPTGTGEGEAESASFRPPDATLRRVRIRDGSIDVTRVTPEGMLASYLRNLDLELTEIRIDSVTFANPVRALAHSRVSLVFDTAYHVLDDSLYFVATTDVRADSRDSVVEIGSFRFTPTLEAAPFFGRLPERADRMNLSAGPIRVAGLDFADYVRDEAVHVRLVEVDSIDLHVHSDIALDWGPRARPCRYHMAFAEIPIPFRIDTVRLNGGTIRYTELAKGSERPGELTFQDVSGTVVNLTNDPERMTAATPAVARLAARLYGEGQVAATVRYPLLSSTLDFEVEASVGPMGLLPANRFATNVTGAEIKEGQLDSLWVGLESRDGKATGRIHMRYRDLNFRLVDRNTGKEMAWHSVLGFLGNVAVRSSNPGNPESEPRDGTIQYTCGDNDMVFFEFFVHSLVSGLKRIVLIL